MSTLPPPPVSVFNGEPCITEADLNGLWPLDDKEPIYSSPKGGVVPPTCGEASPTPAQLPPHSGRFTDQQLITFVFDGDPLPDLPAPVSLPGAGLMLVMAVALLFAMGLPSGQARRQN